MDDKNGPVKVEPGRTPVSGRPQADAMARCLFRDALQYHGKAVIDGRETVQGKNGDSGLFLQLKEVSAHICMPGCLTVC